MRGFRIIGMDWFDLVVHVGVTVMAVVAADTIFGGRDSEVAISMLVAVSMIVLGIWRKRALADSPDAPADSQRVEELEVRVAELEQFQFQVRVAELEERADFAERLLARSRDEAGVPEGRR
ncbi:MAG: hypothetical protein ABI765_16115 [Gemmatimonadota bacterium]